MQPQKPSWANLAAQNKDVPITPKAVSKPSHVDVMDAHRKDARTQIEKILEAKSNLAPGKTTCYMFYEHQGKLRKKSAVAGLTSNLDKLKSNRTEAGIRDKETCCAEEVLLSENPGMTFLFSWTYDTALMIEKKACTKGCKDLLKLKKIEDLVTG